MSAVVTPLGRPSRSLQEDVLALLCHSDTHGRLVSALVDPALFEGDYKEIAASAIGYWRQRGEAPKNHLSNLLANRLESRDGDRYRRILFATRRLSENINSGYVLDEIQRFVREQMLKSAVMRSATALAAGEPVEKVEALLDEVLRARLVQFGRGMRLDDDLDAFIEYLSTEDSEFITGIKPLDDLGIVPRRKTLFLFLGGKGAGKSFFLISIGKHSLLLNHKVLHISLEMDPMEVRKRYYQCLWAASRRRAENDHELIMRLQSDAGGNLLSKGPEYEPTEFALDDPDLRAELEARLELLGGRVENLVIERFPNRSLSIDGLEAYLDKLDKVDRFQPDIVLLDYAKLMKNDARNASDYRIALGQNTERLRACAINRNLAMVTADQLNRRGFESLRSRSSHVGEDWTEVHTADVVINHSATDEERNDGLARLMVSHARGERDRVAVLISQNLNIGQFCLDATWLPAAYFDTMMPGAARSMEGGE